MYRFLLTREWIGLALVMALAAAIMVVLGNWQLSRYHLRSEINDRIDAAAQAPPRPLADVLASPSGGSAVGPTPAEDDAWSLVSATGRYDADHEIVVRARTLDGSTGFGIVTPLVLADGTAILVDRGFLAASVGVAAEIPPTPAPPTGEVVVVGRLRGPESRATAPELVGDRLTVRRIDPAKIAEVLPYPVYGGYLALQSQTPPASPELTPLPPARQNALLNAGYAAQWWIFAALTLVGFGYLARRHAHANRDAEPGQSAEPDGPAEPDVTTGADGVAVTTGPRGSAGPGGSAGPDEPGRASGA